VRGSVLQIRYYVGSRAAATGYPQSLASRRHTYDHNTFISLTFPPPLDYHKHDTLRVNPRTTHRKMRIKLNNEQLEGLAHKLPFEVIVENPRDVKGLLEILGHNMPWDETGLNKFGDPLRKPNRVTFSVEAVDGGFICDIHPAFAIYISNLLIEGQ
jgi:hypothetical protein